jgi:membrane-bound lytic murein transglycosylase B
MRRRLGRGRGGPGLLGTMARTAVVAGTAQAVAGRVGQAQQAAAHRDQQAAAAQEQVRQMQMQAQVDAQVADALRAQTAPPAPVAPPAPASAARPSIDELHAQLTKLGELRQAGLLTDEEFAEQKARLLG